MSSEPKKRRSKRLKRQPWSPADATRQINDIAQHNPDLAITQHAKDQMRDRSLILGDALYCMKCGFVFADAEPATKAGFYKYEIESKTPNSGNRTVRVVVIPSITQRTRLKLVTVMWADEPRERS